MATKIKKVKREKPIPERKLKAVETLRAMIKKNKTMIIASTKNLPSKQFQEIRKKLRGDVDIFVPKKSTIVRALDSEKKESLENFKKSVREDIAVLFSNIDAFELSAMLNDNRVHAAAKAGQVAEEDITVEEGVTDLLPGPAISELGAVGIKIAIEQGKIAIKEKKVIVKKGEKVSVEAASVLQKLDIKPMTIGFEPLAAYNRDEDKIYLNIRVDKEGTLKLFGDSYSKALAFAVSIAYPTKETLKFILAKAVGQEKAIENLLNSSKEENKSSEGIQ